MRERAASAHTSSHSFRMSEAAIGTGGELVRLQTSNLLTAESDRTVRPDIARYRRDRSRAPTPLRPSGGDDLALPDEAPGDPLTYVVEAIVRHRIFRRRIRSEARNVVFS